MARVPGFLGVAFALCFGAVSSLAQEPPQGEAAPPGEESEIVAALPGPSDAPETKSRNAGDPCRIANTMREAWIDRLQTQVHSAVCNSAVWFDHFFGQGETVDSEQFHGYVGVGLLYKASGEWDDQSRFDANVPMPNMSRRLNLFIGRRNEDDFISDQSSSVAEPVAEFERSAGDSWLAGFGYSPPGKRGQRWNFRVGAKVSSNPYVFGQARWRLNYFPSDNRALRVRQTFFYRTNDDQFGGTSAAAYDWFLRNDLMARASTSFTVSQNEHGAAWKSFVTIYHDLSARWGRARGAAYQYFIRGYTEAKVTVPEYGFRVTYRQQMFRPYLFGEAILGYSWDKDDRDGALEFPERKGSVNLGFVVEIRFGSKAKQPGGNQ